MRANSLKVSDTDLMEGQTSGEHFHLKYYLLSSKINSWVRKKIWTREILIIYIELSVSVLSYQVESAGEIF